MKCFNCYSDFTPTFSEPICRQYANLLQNRRGCAKKMRNAGLLLSLMFDILILVYRKIVGSWNNNKDI